MGALRRAKGGKEPESAAQRAAQTREVFLLDELGRFVAGSTSAGVPVDVGMVPKKTLDLARAPVESREIPPGTFLSMDEGDNHAVVFGGLDFFACAGEDALGKREVPHELAAVVAAFERAAKDEIAAGGLSRAMIEAFPRLAAEALKNPSRYAEPPVGPLAFARAAFRASGARLALDIEVVNATPWTAERVQLRIVHDARALPLVSVKAKSGGFADDTLTLPPIPPRSRDRAVVLFEPRQQGLLVVDGMLTLGLEGGRERVARMRPARATILPTRVVPTVPKTLKDFAGLIEGRLRHAAQLDLPDSLGGLATIAGLGTEIEKDHFARILDWYGVGGGREVWYLGLGGGGDRPLLVQLTQAPGAKADLVVAAATLGDLLGYTSSLRARLDFGYAGGAQGAPRVQADLEPEALEPVLRASMVAKNLSADLATDDLETRLRKPRTVAASGIAPVLGGSGGRSVGDEMVPGLIDALERALGPERRGRAPP